MKLFSYVLACAFIAFVLYAVISFVRFVYVRIKAFVIRRKLSKVVKTDVYLDTEKKTDLEKKDD